MTTEKQWMESKWHTDDVLSVREDLTIEQANQVLYKYIYDRDHSADFEVIQYIADEMFPEET